MFSWQTGMAIPSNNFHNPHFFELSAEMRAKALEINGGSGREGLMPYYTVVVEFDPRCEDFNSGRFFNMLERMYQRDADWGMLREAYRNVRHVVDVEINNCRTFIQRLEQERHFRWSRLARLMGSGVKLGFVMHFTTCKLFNRSYAPRLYKLKEYPVMDDRAYANALLTADNKRRGLAERIQIYETYAETAEMLFRTALMAPLEERDACKQRILNYRAELKNLIAATTKAEKVKALRAARQAAVGPRKRKAGDTSSGGGGSRKPRAKPAKRGKRKAEVTESEEEEEEVESSSEEEAEVELDDESEPDSDA